MEVEYTIPDFDLDDELEDADENFGVTPPLIIAYVEAPVDIDFWRDRFGFHELNGIEFRDISQHQPANGKDAIISGIKSGRFTLSKRLIVCLDSDYDNFVNKNQNYYNSDYVFQTYAYAIENIYYHPEHMTTEIQKHIGVVENSTINVVQDKILEWSREYCDYFCYLLINDRCQTKIAKISESIDLNNIKKCTNINTISLAEKQHLNSKGLDSDNLHLYYRGHNFESSLFKSKGIVSNYVSKLRGIKVALNPLITQEEIKEIFSEHVDLPNLLKDRDLSHVCVINDIHADVLSFKSKHWP
ncbi:putative uncharacterized protein [Aliivibrio wodanis]|uniref:DUF4435 domain-containing protein n=1 Tax=Aliivibrio wodanis TaxID=80852 RepID=A0A090KJ43_9GAMM|nr:putative uncharacterized protein [Aliivibrio wodanis]